MRSAGLESITAKHISLTAQSLGLVMAIIPYIKTGVAQYLNPRQVNLLNDFEKIVGDYRNHQNELYMHLVNIMMDRLHTHSQHLLVDLFIIIRLSIGIIQIKKILDLMG